MHIYYKVFTPLGYGVLLAIKQCLGPKLEGVLARGASKTFGTPYFFLQLISASYPQRDGK